MYTGTLISSLMAMAERVGQQAEQARLAEQRELRLREIFSMQIRIVEAERVYLGAA
jgi:hypothetical protein